VISAKGFSDMGERVSLQAWRKKERSCLISKRGEFSIFWVSRVYWICSSNCDFVTLWRKFLPYFVTLVSEPQGCLPPKFHKIGNIKPLAVNSITASLPISSPPLCQGLQCTEIHRTENKTSWEKQLCFQE
jgi:hypothetical protein